MKKAVFGIASNDGIADKIVTGLVNAGFSVEEISILYPDTHKKFTTTNARGNVVLNDALTSSRSSSAKRGTLAVEKHTKASEGGVAGATAGGLIGGSLGLLAGIGALAIPGFGPFVAAGPLLAALSGSAVGGSLGLIIGALVGAGIPEYEAKKFESALKAGGILIAVQAISEEKVTRATEILKREGAKDVSTTREKVRS